MSQKNTMEVEFGGHRKMVNISSAWLCLFILICSFLSFTVTWYNFIALSSSYGWHMVYLWILRAAIFGFFLIIPVLFLIVPATLVTWITVVVLLSFVGKPRRELVVEGKNIIMDMTKLVIRNVINNGDGFRFMSH
ncbi:hypothetical protein AQUCO_03300117v1 [Aquilegia coerulea]|uniref:Uncharacterized protein n=1 Tax=Aquilegia coerulea TaxID=218851 RepID=A0A2G5CZI8_AQUCA|nr:hypothetical protein AQUCO_03300117v1 [Aquilegia coerulea]